MFIIPASSKIKMSPSETMIYENITDINSCVKVEDLKGYIGRKQINDGKINKSNYRTNIQNEVKQVKLHNKYTERS
jgi:hypothetical protein